MGLKSAVWLFLAVLKCIYHCFLFCCYYYIINIIIITTATVGVTLQYFFTTTFTELPLQGLLENDCRQGHFLWPICNFISDLLFWLSNYSERARKKKEEEEKRMEREREKVLLNKLEGFLTLTLCSVCWFLYVHWRTHS